MSTIERLAELAKGIKPIDTDLYGDRHFMESYSTANFTKAQDKFITECTPAAIAQAAAEHAAAVAERDALKVRNGELEVALSLLVEEMKSYGGSPLKVCHTPKEYAPFAFEQAEKAITPSPQSDQEEAWRK